MCICRFQLTAKLCQEVLGGVVDGAIPLDDDSASVVRDTLSILTSKEIKLSSLRRSAALSLSFLPPFSISFRSSISPSSFSFSSSSSSSSFSSSSSSSSSSFSPSSHLLSLHSLPSSPPYPPPGMLVRSWPRKEIRWEQLLLLHKPKSSHR